MASRTLRSSTSQKNGREGSGTIARNSTRQARASRAQSGNQVVADRHRRLAKHPGAGVADLTQGLGQFVADPNGHVRLDEPRDGERPADDVLEAGRRRRVDGSAEGVTDGDLELIDDADGQCVLGIEVIGTSNAKSTSNAAGPSLSTWVEAPAP
jgi:hypothetical protein